MKTADKNRLAAIKQALERRGLKVLKFRQLAQHYLRVYRRPKHYGLEYVDLSFNTQKHLLDEVNYHESKHPNETEQPNRNKRTQGSRKNRS